MWLKSIYAGSTLKGEDAMKLMVFLSNETSGDLDEVSITVKDEDDITAAVIAVMEDKHWALRDGDSVTIAHVDP